MDKTEKFIREELSNGANTSQLDVDAVIAGTHINIKKRASRRKALYSSPIVVLLVILGIALFTNNDEPYPAICLSFFISFGVLLVLFE